MTDNELISETIEVNGTLIWYMNICKRQVWLMSHGIVPDQENDLLFLGKFLHENSYKRQHKEVNFENLKFDLIDSNEGNIVIGEVKKSSSAIESAELQLKYYLYRLRKYGYNVKGVLSFPSERKRVNIELTEDDYRKIEEIELEVKKLVAEKKPPKAIKIKRCKNCAYAEQCWA
jgi:CRISPR-associated exonuclease Cas4